MGAHGEIVESLAGGVDLVIMPSVREGEQLIEPGGKPGRVFRHVDLTGFEAGRLSEEARLLLVAGAAQDRASFAGAPEVLSDGSANVGVFDNGLVGAPLAREAQHLAP